VIGGPEKRRSDSRLFRRSGGQGCCGVRAPKDQRPCQRHQTSRTGQTAAILTTRRFTESQSARLYGSLRETASRRSSLPLDEVAEVLARGLNRRRYRS
jgi:hypothetical protein